MDQKNEKQAIKPWYKYPMVWFVIGLPMTVVIASLTTVAIAFKNSPEVLEYNISYKKTIEDNPEKKE